MKLGFCTAILPDCSFAEVIQFAGSEGFECLEVMCWPPGKAERRYAGVTHIDVEDMNESSIAQCLQLCETHGVEISALGYYPNPLAPNEEEAAVAQAHLAKVITAAPRLGLHRVNTFIGRDWKLSVEENWDRMLSAWRPLVALAEQHDVKIGIENCPMWFTADEWPGGKNLATTPKIWRQLFADLDSQHIGLNYDPSHMVWQQMDYLAPMRDFADRLHHVHAKDVRIDRHKLNDVGIMAHPLEYHTPKLPGLGDVDWGKFFSVLSDTGYDGPVCIEVEDRAYEGSLERRQESLKQSGRFLRNFM